MSSASEVEARLRERDQDRKAAVEKRRAKKEEGQRIEESSGYFAQQFAEKKAGNLGRGYDFGDFFNNIS